MKPLRAAFVVCFALVASSLATTYKVPEDDTVATINAPAGWKANNYDKGIELTSDDGEVYIAIEATDAKGVERSMDEAMAYLKNKGVTVDAIALNQGRTQQLWRVDITDERGRLIAHGEVRLQNVPGAPAV